MILPAISVFDNSSNGEEECHEEDLETVFERFVFGGDDRNVKEVYVKGRLVAGTSGKGL